LDSGLDRLEPLGIIEAWFRDLMTSEKFMGVIEFEPTGTLPVREPRHSDSPQHKLSFQINRKITLFTVVLFQY